MSEKLKPLFVGEDNPHSADPRYALWPYPPGCAGSRLQGKILDLSLSQYVRKFDRVNLCARRWSETEARASAARIKGEDRPLVILLGSKVSLAFGGFSTGITEVLLHGAERRLYLFLPHPSGRNRVWNEPGAVGRARALFEEACRRAGVEL